MVSLKKEPQIREVTPVHLMDEEEAIRTYCPPRAEAANNIEIVVKQADEKLLPAVKTNRENKVELEHTTDKLDKWELFEMIFEAILMLGIVTALILGVGGFIGEGLQLVKKLNGIP